MKCIDLFFFLFYCVCFFNPSSCGYRMTQIGNTISGVTGLRSVWWTLVMLSPSLLTPGSKCMHGRSEKLKHKQTNLPAPFGFDCSILFIPCLFIISTSFPFTLALYHVDRLSPCTQRNQLEQPPGSFHGNYCQFDGNKLLGVSYFVHIFISWASCENNTPFQKPDAQEQKLCCKNYRL